ncbi:cyclic nucleotide-binding domain-containing protein [Synechococcus sp. CCY9201]|uniref:cyclic nucleotide-binding domain-containing protein n=1 Tax=Synechococcus sp. CCY9201 TaxID=174697 RepID=UPI002B21C5BF|nr:cyclic nucleotide-binding domain-containing protein [Synechococcus sp. CCY9201]MEA5474548.1 cyclic nucleotide-binding domain-containing protein [Synechococcus sp. CCY9201]
MCRSEDGQVTERRMHLVRWALTTGWLLIIASLLYDPFTPRFTEPDHPWSPLRLPADCVPVQGTCLTEAPYPLGTTLFWGLVVPAGVFVLLVFGHELWRRICPLSFLSQIPRALGLQRQITRVNPKTGEKRFQLAKVPGDSWLGKHYSQLQFGWLYVGLCGRILFFNADRLVLFAWLSFTIVCAIAVGWLYGGKSWCQYFCPMAPVQSIYSTPTGLLGSRAHMAATPITQSMCRTVQPDGAEQSACVACQQPCIDIDAERTYWARLPTPAFAFERYGYVGLVLGYFLYYYLYAGNWDYYFSGVWLRQSDQLALLLRPGFVLFGQPIDVPRLVAVPLFLGLCTWLGVLVGRAIESGLRGQVRRRGAEPDRDRIRHRVFLVATYLVFNFFFLFSGRPLILLLPAWVQYLYDVILVALSTLWLYRAWGRSPALYGRENLAERFRKQLARMDLDVGRYLDGRSIADLGTEEVYVLAKVLPGFTGQKRLEAYKGVVREALEEGFVNAASSLDVLKQMRLSLGISDDEHRQLLEELGVEDPGLLDPDSRRSLEDQIRLSGYRKSLERLLLVQSLGDGSGRAGARGDARDDWGALRALRREYGISLGEEQRVLGDISPRAAAIRKLELLLDRLPALTGGYRALHQSALRDQTAVLDLLDDRLQLRKELTLRAILAGLVTLQEDPVVPALVQRLQAISPLGLPELVQGDDWAGRLPTAVAEALAQPGGEIASCRLDLPVADTLTFLDSLAADPSPTMAAAALYLTACLDAERARSLAVQVSGKDTPPLLAQTAQAVGALQGPPALRDCPELEKRVFLATSDFFRRSDADTLATLAEQADMRSFCRGDLITEAGDTCRELLLLIEGRAQVRHRDGEREWLEDMEPGRVLDELEVLTHSTSESTIVAEADGTRVLAVPVDSFDVVLERDPDFARRVLELESAQLQRLMRAKAG